MSILEIKNLKVDYETEENTVHALINVSLQMTGGETLGLVGETGAGTSSAAYRKDPHRRDSLWWRGPAEKGQ